MPIKPDYSEFPWEMWSTDELGRMLIEAVNVGDKAFADELRKQIKSRPNQSSAYAKQVDRFLSHPPGE